MMDAPIKCQPTRITMYGSIDIETIHKQMDSEFVVSFYQCGSISNLCVEGRGAEPNLFIVGFAKIEVQLHVLSNAVDGCFRFEL